MAFFDFPIFRKKMIILRSECIDSRLGAVIVGSLSLIGSIIAMIQVAISINWYLNGKTRSTIYMVAFPECTLEMFLVLHAYSSILMMFGAIKERPTLMLPWLGTFIAAIIISFAVSFGLMMNFILFTGWRCNLIHYATAMVITALILAVETLLCAIVYNHYEHLVYGKLMQSSDPCPQDEPIVKTDPTYHKV